MNILLVAKLSNHSLDCILEPLHQLSYIKHIYVLRDTIGNINSKKITYITDKNLNPKSKLRHILRLRKGLSLCKKQKIDLVIGVLLYPHGYIGRMISLIKNLPYIHVTIAGHREFWVMGNLVERINYYFFRKSFAITVTGTNTSKYLICKGYSAKNIIVLPNVIKMETFSDGKKTRNIDIVSLSRVDKNKNISLLLKAIYKLNKNLIVKAIIAGDGPELNNLMNEAKKLGIENNIEFPGWIYLPDKMNIYNRAKIFVLCSKGEGFPLSLLEAMACGCVPVVTDVGDISDVIVNDENGYMIKDYDNENELVAKLELLIENPAKIQMLSSKAQEVKTQYSFANASEIWDKLLAKKLKDDINFK